MASLIVACSTWSGPGASDGKGNGGNGDKDGSTADMDAGDASGAMGDAGEGPDPMGDAGDDSGLALPASLGDPRMGHVACEAKSCGPESLCCTTGTSTPRSQCEQSCGGTEGHIACDGPEDCGHGEVCCHQLDGVGLAGQCIPAFASEIDSGAATPMCATEPAGPELRVACHRDADCAQTPDTPLCRADAGRRPYLGYCVPDTDDPATKGHDDVGLVACGDGLGATCTLSTNTCCLSQEDGTRAACSARPSCGFSEVAITCDGPEDCDEGVCCFVPKQGSMDAGSPGAQSVCAARCDGLGSGALRRCHVDADCDGTACIEDPASPFWGRCEGI
jgi:hypothetical protein